MKNLLYISELYTDLEKTKQVLNAIKPVSSFFISYYSYDDLTFFRENQIEFQIIQKDVLYNYLRENIDFLVIFYDAEDKVAERLIKYCVIHGIPLLIHTIGDLHKEHELLYL